MEATRRWGVVCQATILDDLTQFTPWLHALVAGGGGFQGARGASRSVASACRGRLGCVST